MKRLLPLAIVISLLLATALVVSLAYGSEAPAGSKAAGRQTSDSPAASAMCVQDHPDCNDMVVGNDGITSERSCAFPSPNGAECIDTCHVTTSVAVDCPAGWPDDQFCSLNAEFAVCNSAGPVCTDAGLAADVPCVSGPVDGGGGTSTGPSEPVGGAAATYDITVPFDTTVTDDATKLANEVVLSFDPGASFLLQESFPPTGRATITSADPNVCSEIKAKLEGVHSVGDVTCVASAPTPPCCKPDEPVSSTPGSEPGFNPDGPNTNPSGPSQGPPDAP